MAGVNSVPIAQNGIGGNFLGLSLTKGIALHKSTVATGLVTIPNVRKLLKNPLIILTAWEVVEVGFVLGPCSEIGRTMGTHSKVSFTCTEHLHASVWFERNSLRKVLIRHCKLATTSCTPCLRTVLPLRL